MEDGEKDMDAGNADMEEGGSSLAPSRSLNLRDVNKKLKEEALRRYRAKHGSDALGDMKVKKSKNLQAATSQLKAEALRQYKERHRGSLDRAETEMEEQLGKMRSHGPKSPSPGLCTPTIDEVFQDESQQTDSPQVAVTMEQSNFGENSHSDAPEGHKGNLGQESEVASSHGNSSGKDRPASASSVAIVVPHVDEKSGDAELDNRTTEANLNKSPSTTPVHMDVPLNQKPRNTRVVNEGNPSVTNVSNTQRESNTVSKVNQTLNGDLMSGGTQKPYGDSRSLLGEYRHDANNDTSTLHKIQGSDQQEVPHDHGGSHDHEMDPSDEMADKETSSQLGEVPQQEDPTIQKDQQAESVEGTFNGGGNTDSRPGSGMKHQDSRPSSRTKDLGSRPSSAVNGKVSRPQSAAKEGPGSRPVSAGKVGGSRPGSSRPSSASQIAVQLDGSNTQREEESTQQDPSTIEAKEQTSSGDVPTEDEQLDEIQGESGEGTTEKSPTPPDHDNTVEQSGAQPADDAGQLGDNIDDVQKAAGADTVQEADPVDGAPSNEAGNVTSDGGEDTAAASSHPPPEGQDGANVTAEPSSDQTQQEPSSGTQPAQNSDANTSAAVESKEQENEDQPGGSTSVRQTELQAVESEGQGQNQTEVQGQAERRGQAEGQEQAEGQVQVENENTTAPKSTDPTSATSEDVNGAEQTPADDQEPLPEGQEGEQAEIDTARSVDGLSEDTRGDEDQIHSEQILGDDSKAKIPDDFYYEKEDHISRAAVTEDSGIPSDLLTLRHSFGYDCQKRSNLYMVDAETSVFAAGNVVQLLNLTTKEQQYLRSTSGGGIGAIGIHPERNFIAVAEKGQAPNINVYEYPSLRLFRVLRGGTQEAYNFVDFSPDGRLLASVGGDPDYMLTLWDWKQEKTMLRSKAFSQDVFRVTFSSELPGQLTSSGTGHIRFWKMAKTFTGLKLQGQLGKFGKTEISDIDGYVELPDGKVLSGSEWGNLLLWDGGLIKVEISRKGKPCHLGPIQQIIMDEGELMTIGYDGYIRVWDFEKVDTADSTDESGIFEMEPMNELKVGNDVQLKSIVKSVNPEEPTMWYAQDACGGIWKLDLSFSFTSLAPEKLQSYHSGVITGCDTSPVSHLVATTGVDHSVRVYDYAAQKPVCESRFNQPGSSLMWVPATVDPKGATVLVGFDDGVVRVFSLQKKETIDVHGRKHTDESELSLKQVFKPHSDRVACMALDSRGEILATGSADNTVFFLNAGQTFEPIGFIRTPSPVTSLDWAPGKFEKHTLIVSCVEGQILELEAPEPGQFDTSHSFEIEGMPVRNHQFKSVKSRLRHEEELARKTKEEEEQRKKEEEERRIRIERGLETDSEKGDEPEEQKEDKEEEWVPYIPEKPSPILHGFHGNQPGKFWLSMGEFDSGYLYECEFLDESDRSRIPDEELHEPTRCVPVLDSNDSPVTTMIQSRDGKRLVMGLGDGSVRIHQLQSNDVGLLGPFWHLAIHDNHYGRITHVASSFDDKFLFTVGADGNFFVFDVMDQERMEKRVAEERAKIPSAKKEEAERRVDDIEDPKAYSIEDAKQKSEYDKMMKLAEEKKASVRRTIDGLRTQFRGLLDKNVQLPPHLQLNRKEFEMDIEIKRELERQTQEKVESVKRAMAWEEEKHRLALEKLRNRFKVVVECERIVLKAFNSAHEVSSFRASKLPDDFYAAQAELEKRRTTILSKEEASRQATQELLKGKTQVNESQEGEEAKGDTDTKVTTTLKGSMGERINKALAKVEEKKKKRSARRAQWEALESIRPPGNIDIPNRGQTSQRPWDDLYGSKPSDDYEDPADVAAIRHAQENMGDYKLKSADDYVVPDHLRMNTEKARARLLALKELLHNHKYDFNQLLLSLRDKKLAIIDDVRHLVGQLRAVQAKLAPDSIKPVPAIPSLHPDEIPEKKFEFTREMLLKFKVELEEREKNPLQKGASSAGGFGGFGAGASAPVDNKNASPTPPPSSVATLRQSTTLISERSLVEPEWTMTQDENQMSELEKKIQKAEEIRLLYEQDRLLACIDDLLKNYDAELRCLRHKKFELEIVLKNADLRQVTLFEELLLLKDFEKRENVLAAKLESKQQEKLDMQAKVVEVQQRLEGKKKDIERLQEKERALHAQFMASLGENNKFADYLSKVFKKKIKRTKKKATEGEGSDEESDEDSDDESDWSESGEESDSEAGGYDLDICPAGCDQALYDGTCALREKRLDLEEALVEEKKNRDGFHKEVDTLGKKTRVIDAALRNAENELEAFQLEKQRKLNELDVVVTLTLSQVQYMVNGILPQDLSSALVFEAAGVTRLSHRIKELEHEKGLQKKQQKDAKRKHIQLLKDRKVFQSRIVEMEDTCNKMMLQKFGRIVDLEKLETVTVNRNIEELKERLRQNEEQCSRDLIQWDKDISESKDHITELIRENTNRLDQLNMLLGEKKSFGGELDLRQKNLGDEFSGVRKADIHERQRLVQLVQLQAQEVEALKEEIMLLSRKGGHILPPAQPPLPMSSQGSRPVPNT